MRTWGGSYCFCQPVLFWQWKKKQRPVWDPSTAHTWVCIFLGGFEMLRKARDLVLGGPASASALLSAVGRQLCQCQGEHCFGWGDRDGWVGCPREGACECEGAYVWGLGGVHVLVLSAVCGLCLCKALARVSHVGGVWASANTGNCGCRRTRDGGQEWCHPSESVGVTFFVAYEGKVGVRGWERHKQRGKGGPPRGGEQLGGCNLGGAWEWCSSENLGGIWRMAWKLREGSAPALGSCYLFKLKPGLWVPRGSARGKGGEWCGGERPSRFSWEKLLTGYRSSQQLLAHQFLWGHLLCAKRGAREELSRSQVCSSRGHSLVKKS